MPQLLLGRLSLRELVALCMLMQVIWLRKGVGKVRLEQEEATTVAQQLIKPSKNIVKYGQTKNKILLSWELLEVCLVTI